MNKRFLERIRILKYMLGTAAGVLFVLLYIRAAAADVVYSDYIRLIHDYLPDVGNPAKFFVPDILTRIPAAFLGRLINVGTFGYSVTFDRILSVLGLLMMAVCLEVYEYRHETAFWWRIVIWIALFSLNKWEILLNGTAWAHVVSFGLFFASYLLLDLVWTGEADSKQEFAICGMPLVLLLFAGEYIVSYACTVMLICLLGILTGGANSWAGRREQTIFRHVLLSSAAALLLYLLSRHFAVWEHAGATELGVTEVLSSNPLFFLRLFVKSFAGAVVGQETIAAFFADGAALPDGVVLGLGVGMLAAYGLAFVLYFQREMLEKTVFPLILLISGFVNHVLVTMARWIFLNDNYALSSRYGLQFLVGILGMLLIFSARRETRRGGRRKDAGRRQAVRAATVLIAVFIAAGNCYTTYQEIRKAPYREANYERMAEAILHYEEYPEEELLAALEWHKDPAILYDALQILRDNRLNVFHRPHFEDDGGAGAESTSAKPERSDDTTDSPAQPAESRDAA